MTKFDKSKFSYHGGYLMYGDKFVARFKHRGPVTKGIFLDPKWYNAVLEAYQAKIQAKYGIRPIKFL